MSNLPRYAALLLTSTTLLACDREAEDPALSGPVATRSAAQVCDPSNQIVVFASPVSCDSVLGGTWQGERLFDPAGVPSGLRRYCKYTYYKAGSQPDVKTLAEELGNTFAPPFEMGADCQAVQPQGSAITDEIGDDLDQYFGWLSGRITPDDVAAAALADDEPSPVPHPVHIAVVDTFPRAEPLDPLSTHGPVVTSIIESFVCPSGAGCDIQVRNYLGLPRTGASSVPNTTMGGLLGRQSDLAKGVMHALQEHQSNHSTSKLVINLSVAWEAEQFGGMDSGDLPPPVRAVYDALRVARCRGALIIAAAGNESQLSCLGEPMAPARWEEFDAPTGPECAALGIPAPQVYVDPAPYTPLVHAVGGLFGPNTEMAISREEGMPRLAAASSHAVAHPRDGLPELAVPTGTSVGTAVASAAASLVWSYDSSLSPSRVMRRLYASGDPVGSVTADFPLVPSGGSLPVHRIDACSAVQTVVPFDLDCDTTAPVTIPQLVSAAAGAVTDPVQAVSVEPAQPCTNACGDDVMFYAHAGSSRDCTDIAADPWTRLTEPQPIISGCHECITTVETSSQDAHVLISLVSDFEDHTLVEVDVEVYDATGAPHRFGVAEKDLPSGVLPPTRVAIRDYDVPIDLAGIIPTRASIYMVFLDPDTEERTETFDTMILRVE